MTTPWVGTLARGYKATAGVLGPRMFDLWIKWGPDTGNMWASKETSPPD